MSPAGQPDNGRSGAGEPIDLYTSWRGILASTLTPVILVVLPLWAMVSRRVHPIALVVLTVGVLLGLVALLDYPWRTRFDVSGVARHSVLRTQRLTWDDIDGLARSREPRRLGRSTEDTDPATSGRIGGIVVVRGRRSYLCTDRPESRDEHGALVAALAVWAPTVPQRLPAPPVDTPPTTLYRRRRDA
ncbi:MAG: hypothetical protein S0880_04230 [Actinomycetota bacterium]|nr:hypothetical protein [Actinomycetota bacterium]